MNGKTSGVVPFIRVMDSLTLAISQGSLRAARPAVYLPVSHPEIEEFIEIRRPDRRRSQPQGAQPPSRPADLRRLHARGRERRGMGAGQPEGRRGPAQDLGALAVDPHPDGARRDRRAVPGSSSTT
jgi:hypothetical protein